MNHAKSSAVRDDKIAPKGKRTKAVPSVGKLLGMDAKAKRRSGYDQRSNKVCSGKPVTNGFLKTAFLPKMSLPQKGRTLERDGQLENDFYRSLSLVAACYGLTPMETANLDYPYNLAVALWDINNKVNRSVDHFDKLYLVKDKTKSYFISEHRFDTRTTLYYIPVIPLFIMLKDTRRKANALLLLSVCAYFYHCADIPYYRQEGSYLYYEYEMLKEWILDDGDSEDQTGNLGEIEKAKWIGDAMEKKICNKINLERFLVRIECFKVSDGFDSDCLKLARASYDLYCKHPKTSLFRTAGNTHVDDDDCQYLLLMGQYISFYADSRGWLNDTLLETVNMQFNECTEIEEPLLRNSFDGSDLLYQDLGFESRVLALIDDLCLILNEYKRNDHEG